MSVDDGNESLEFHTNFLSFRYLFVLYTIQQVICNTRRPLSGWVFLSRFKMDLGALDLPRTNPHIRPTPSPSAYLPLPTPNFTQDVYPHPVATLIMEIGDPSWRGDSRRWTYHLVYFQNVNTYRCAPVHSRRSIQLRSEALYSCIVPMVAPADYHRRASSGGDLSINKRRMMNSP